MMYRGVNVGREIWTNVLEKLGAVSGGGIDDGNGKNNGGADKREDRPMYFQKVKKEVIDELWTVVTRIQDSSGTTLVEKIECKKIEAEGGDEKDSCRETASMQSATGTRVSPNDDPALDLAVPDVTRGDVLRLIIEDEKKLNSIVSRIMHTVKETRKEYLFFLTGDIPKNSTTATDNLIRCSDELLTLRLVARSVKLSIRIEEIYNAGVNDVIEGDTDIRVEVLREVSRYSLNRIDLICIYTTLRLVLCGRVDRGKSSSFLLQLIKLVNKQGHLDSFAKLDKEVRKLIDSLSKKMHFLEWNTDPEKSKLLAALLHVNDSYYKVRSGCKKKRITKGISQLACENVLGIVSSPANIESINRTYDILSCAQNRNLSAINRSRGTYHHENQMYEDEEKDNLYGVVVTLANIFRHEYSTMMANAAMCGYWGYSGREDNYREFVADICDMNTVELSLLRDKSRSQELSSVLDENIEVLARIFEISKEYNGKTSVEVESILHALWSVDLRCIRSIMCNRHLGRDKLVEQVTALTAIEIVHRIANSFNTRRLKRRSYDVDKSDFDEILARAGRISYDVEESDFDEILARAGRISDEVLVAVNRESPTGDNDKEWSIRESRHCTTGTRKTDYLAEWVTPIIMSTIPEIRSVSYSNRVVFRRSKPVTRDSHSSLVTPEARLANSRIVALIERGVIIRKKPYKVILRWMLIVALLLITVLCFVLNFISASGRDSSKFQIVSLILTAAAVIMVIIGFAVIMTSNEIWSLLTINKRITKSDELYEEYRMEGGAIKLAEALGLLKTIHAGYSYTCAAKTEWMSEGLRSASLITKKDLSAVSYFYNKDAELVLHYRENGENGEDREYIAIIGRIEVSANGMMHATISGNYTGEIDNLFVESYFLGTKRYMSTCMH